jgi:hypothetical protein
VSELNAFVSWLVSIALGIASSHCQKLGYIGHRFIVI